MHHPHDQARSHRRRGGDPKPWPTVLAWVGVLAAIVGATVVGLDVLVCDGSTPDVASLSAGGFPGGDPFPGAPIPADYRIGGATGGEAPRSDDAGFGIGLFFGGFALAATGGLAHARRRHQVTGSDPTP